MGLEGQPEFQGAGFAGQLQRAVEQVDGVFTAYHVFQILGRHGKGAFQRTGVAHQHHAAVIGLEQPLVRIDHQRVGQFHARQFLCPLRRQGGRSTVGSVHMQPQVLGARQCRDGVQWIDRAGVGAASVADDHHRCVTGRFIRLDGLRKRIDVIFLLRIGFQHPDVGRVQTCCGEVALERGVGLVIGIDHAAPLGCEGGSKGREIGQRPAGDDDALGAFGHAHALAQPVDHHQFRHRRTRTTNPGRGDAVKACGQPIAQNAGEGRRRGHAGEVARVVAVLLVRNHVRPQSGQSAGSIRWF